jgi:chromosome segregation ATPase
MQEQMGSHSDPSFLPRAVGRSNSVVGGKPVHLHRVIKDRANSVIVTPTVTVMDKRPALIPITNSLAVDNTRASIDALVQGGPSGLLKLDKVGGSENDTKEFLRKRIKELEKEVTKLNNHIHQAEMAIKNYRVSLSEKSPRVGSSSGKECSVQTDPDDTAELQASLKAIQVKLLATVEELRCVKAAKDAMFNERKQLQEVSKRKEEYLLNTVQTNEDHLAQQAVRIRELEVQLSAASGVAGVAPAITAAMQSVSPTQDIQHSDKILESMLVALTEAQKLRQELISIKKSVASESTATLSAMTAGCQELLQKISEVRSATPAVSASTENSGQRVEQVARETALLRAQLQESHDQCTSLRAEAARLKSENATLADTIAAAVRHTADQCTNTEPARLMCDASTSTPGASPLSTPAKPVLPPPAETTSLMIDACGSPLSPLANRSNYNAAAANAAAAIQVDLHVQTKLRLAEKEAELSELQARADRDRALLRQQSDDLNALRQRLLSERERYDAVCRAQESQLAQRAGQCAAHQQRADAFQQRLGQATHALQGLQEVHAAEVKAVRHEAHIRDLQRVAKERETDLEKDRLQIELKHIKYVVIKWPVWFRCLTHYGCFVQGGAKHSHILAEHRGAESQRGAAARGGEARAGPREAPEAARADDQRPAPGPGPALRGYLRGELGAPGRLPEEGGDEQCRGAGDDARCDETAVEHPADTGTTASLRYRAR